MEHSPNNNHYKDEFIAFLEMMRGDGCLSPGGVSDEKTRLNNDK
ncbi:MAG: hypothetical protein ACPG8W_19440 [Candidatus Promineifilaceae bacterium]